MKMRFLASFAALAVFGTGCVVDNPGAYDSCKSAKDCTGALADTCVGVTQVWSTGTSYDNICTTGCTTDSGCSLSFNGVLGYCSSTTVLGAAAGTCFERCGSSSDCSAGFACAGSKDVAGLEPGEYICVPGTLPLPPAYAYESCAPGSGHSCDGTYAAYCTAVSQNWSNGTTSNQICTNGCASDAGCATSWNGSNGFCSSSTILGTPAGTCFERCYYDSDCATGFVCGDSKEVSNLPGNEQICVPAPNPGYVPPLSDPYETCDNLNDCSLASTRCEAFDPKWETTSASNSINVCTKACSFDSDCPNSYSGQTGYCAPQNSIAVMQVCVERCYSSNDCLSGFVCAEMEDIAGLPNSKEGVCVPYPY